MNRGVQKAMAKIMYYMGAIMGLSGFYLHHLAERLEWADATADFALVGLVLVGPVALVGALAIIIKAE